MSERNEPLNRQDGFQRSFVVDVDPDTVWQRLTRPPSQPGDGTRYNIAGLEADCIEVECEPGEFLRMIKDEEPCKGTEVIVRLEHAGNGTRVTVTQSGFGPWLPDVIEMFGSVWNVIVADLMLYLETGIRIKTHLFGGPAPTVSLGCKLADRLTGLEVTEVDDDGFCRRAGIRPGDLLVRLNHVRLVNGMQLGNLLQLATPGQELLAEWARGAEFMQGAATV